MRCILQTVVFFVFPVVMPPRQSFPSHPRVRDAAALGFTSSLGPFAANGIMPGFHAMAEDYGVSFVAVQQSLTIYLFTYAFFSLVAGSFSDSYGRRPTFIGGMLLFAAASVSAAFSQSLWALYGWRLLQGIGAAVGQVVTQAIVRDNWSGPEAANVNGMIAFFFAAGPALAPVVGGQIVMHFGWHAVFLFLMVYSLSIAFFIYFRIPETLNAADRSAFNLSVICSNYAKGLTHGAFMTGVVAHGILFMGGILYSAGSADFVIKVMGLDVDEFGWLSIPLIFASFAGAWGSIRLAKRLRPKRMIVIVSLLTLAGSVLAAVFDYLTQPGFLLLLIAPVLYSLGMALLRPVMMAMNLDYFPKNRGMAAAIQQFFITASFCFSAAVWVPIVMGSAEICTCFRLLRPAGSVAMAYVHAIAPRSTQTSGRSGNHAVSYLNLRLFTSVFEPFALRMHYTCTHAENGRHHHSFFRDTGRHGSFCPTCCPSTFGT